MNDNTNDRINQLQSEKNHYEQTSNELGVKLDEASQLVEKMRRSLAIIKKHQDGEVIDNASFEEAKKFLTEQCSLGMLSYAFKESNAQEEPTKTPSM